MTSEPVNQMLAGLHMAKWAVVAVIGTWLSVPGSVVTLTGFVIADFATGLIAAWVQKRVNSETAMRGFTRKVLLVGMVLAMHYAEGSLGREMGIETWISAYFIVIEVISIVENCARVGVPIPVLLVEALLKVRDFYPRTMAPEEVEAAFRRTDRPRRKAASGPADKGAASAGGSEK